MSADTAEGEFRVPEDVEADTDTDTGADTDTDTAADTDTASPDDFSDVDLTTTPGTMVGAVALGVVAAPLLGVYAVLFVTRYFLQPGVAPDITGSWTGEGLAGVVAAVLALVLLVIVARAAGGRGLPVFVGAQLLVVATCGYLLSDSTFGGARVSLAAAVLALLPGSRRWFGAHAADRAEQASPRA